MHYIVITRTDHTSDAELGHYLANVGATMEPFRGRLLAFGAPARLEGETAYTKTAILEFPAEADADGWYHSPAYQALAEWRIATMGHPVTIASVSGLAA
ncbi:DUF1330 domain-containing protein [Streptomyces sp. 1331.2]|uniref:DUF1330 domain-containing protein n=1 Tax=Streptomyces sp. 1331.2 TaxID=1938835 RepID=UPI000BD0CFC1|nr:DUF1330 domain-containing protein [Streptomyces sp. 1331.2]SOB81510.1 Uncharacterized conserved protein, DUF1330 family [Streptomyces sp. 1331.2]